MTKEEIQALLKETLPGLLKESLPGELQAAVKETLPGLLKDAINPAITSHTKRLQKDFDDKIAALKPAKSEEDDAEAKAKADAEAKAKADANKPDPRLEAALKQIADLTKAQKSAEAQALAERRARVEDAAYQTLHKHLAGKVLPGAESDLVDLLRARKQVTVTDSGDLRFRLSAQDPEEGLDLETGVSQLVKLPTIKHFLPAPNAGQPAKRPLGSHSASPLNGKPSPAEAFEAKTGKSIDSLL